MFDVTKSFGSVLGAFLASIREAVTEGPMPARVLESYLSDQGIPFPCPKKSKAHRTLCITQALLMLKSVPESSDYLTSVQRVGICLPEHRTKAGRARLNLQKKAWEKDLQTEKNPQVIAYLQKKLGK